MSSLLRFYLLAVFALLFMVTAADILDHCRTVLKEDFFHDGIYDSGLQSLENHSEHCKNETLQCYTFVCYADGRYLAGKGCPEYFDEHCKLTAKVKANLKTMLGRKDYDSYDENVIWNGCAFNNCNDRDMSERFRNMTMSDRVTKFGDYIIGDIQFNGTSFDIFPVTPVVIPVANATTLPSNDTDGNVTTSSNMAPSQVLSGSIVIAAMIWLSVLFV